MQGHGSLLRQSAAALCWVPLGAWVASGGWIPSGAALAADSRPANTEVRSLAATCAACHGTDGHAVPGSSMPRLAGRPKADFLRQMRALRDGSREATVMQQIASGYTDQQLDTLGDFFAAQR